MKVRTTRVHTRVLAPKTKAENKKQKKVNGRMKKGVYQQKGFDTILSTNC
jgi:hypothetical protein